jgi:uncharacterized membrane protein
VPNRLAQERSPYLLQHAENPVEWFPWGGGWLSMNERSLQDIVEWILIGLLLAVVLLVVLWLGGWVFTFLGFLLRAISGIVWLLLKVAILLAIVAAIVFAIYWLVQRNGNKSRTS